MKKLYIFALLIMLGLTACTTVSNKVGGAVSSTEDYLSDSSITTGVKAGLLAGKGVSGTDINVVTNDGIVTLTGFVETKEQMNEAIRIASEVNGVKGIKSKLALKAATVSDSKIAKDIKTAYKNDATLSNYKIRIEVNSGEVILTGNVATRTEKERAAEKASTVYGVSKVHNYIEIQ